MIKSPEVQTCPECQVPMDSGFIQGPSFGVVWIKNAKVHWMPIFNKNVEKLQKNYWGFPKLAKEALPAVRCRKCKLVTFRYNAEDTGDL